MIGISTVLFDLDGYVVLPRHRLNSPSAAVLTRRVTSTKTLDGGAYVSDFGYSATDDDLIYHCRELTETEILNFKRLLRLHSEFIVTNDDGAFLCVMKNLNYSKGVLLVQFAVKGTA